MRDLITKKFDISDKNFNFAVLLIQKLESKTLEHTPMWREIVLATPIIELHEFLLKFDLEFDFFGCIFQN